MPAAGYQQIRGRGWGSATFAPNPCLVPGTGLLPLFWKLVSALVGYTRFLEGYSPPVRPDIDDAGVSLVVPLVVLSLSGESPHGESPYGEEVSAS
jgi:hypothetical protein